jgi:hypothetical protein
MLSRGSPRRVYVETEGPRPPAPSGMDSAAQHERWPLLYKGQRYSRISSDRTSVAVIGTLTWTVEHLAAHLRIAPCTKSECMEREHVPVPPGAAGDRYTRQVSNGAGCRHQRGSDCAFVSRCRSLVAAAAFSCLCASNLALVQEVKSDPEHRYVTRKHRSRITCFRHAAAIQRVARHAYKLGFSGRGSNHGDGTRTDDRGS